MRLSYGTIELPRGFKFQWRATEGNEVCGHIEQPDGSVLPKSFGWWRTEDPQEAAKVAERIVS